MTRLRIARVLAVGLLVGAGALVRTSPDVAADAPIKQGWWSRWQQPATSMSVILPVTVPPPPTGAAGGLTIARDVTQPTAVAALNFQVAVGADISLYLGAAEATGIQLPPGAIVRACLAASPWAAQLNGSWSDAPAWSVNTCETATLVPGGAGFLWELPSTMQDEDGAYDLVIVPDGQGPYFVNLAATGEQTAVPDEVPPVETTTTTTVPEETTTTTTTTDTTTPVETTEETDPIVSYEVGGGRGGGVAAPVPTTTPARTEPATLVAFGPPQVAGAPFPLSLPDSRGERIFAVSLLFFMAVALWWLGGSPARMPRLIGALSAADARPRRVPDPTRGIGRFARPRPAAVRPQRL